MKRLTLLIILIAALVGCVSSGMVPYREALTKFQCAHIIPMESHPLGVPPAFGSVVPGFGGGSLQEIRGFSVFNTVAILLEMPAASRRGGEASQAIQAKLDNKDRWVPTVVLANEVQAQLAASGTTATVSPEIRPIPGVENRGYTVLMENWMAPIRAWYNSSVPVADYRDVANDGCRRYIIEIGILNYEITSDKLFVQVVTKVIDPTDSRVIGRARAANPWSMPKITPFDQAFADDARRFKEAFSATTRDLVNKCLKELGLL